MIAKSDIFYPGHDTPFQLKNDEIVYLDDPTTINIMSNSEAGKNPLINYQVLDKRKVNVNTFQNRKHPHTC